MFDLSQPPPEGVFYNRVSASSHTRDHRYATELLQRAEAKNRFAAIVPLADPLISLGSPGPPSWPR